MFTGIIQKTGTVTGFDRLPDGAGRLALDCDPWADGLKLGESISTNGVCLTVTSVQHRIVVFDLLAETIDRTNLGELGKGDLVNLERALRVGDALGGHFVTGHVDGTGVTLAWEPVGRDIVWRMQCDVALTNGMVPKGSIACDGISLTIVDLADGEFSVHIIPHTLAHTRLSRARLGCRVNLETDMLGKYILRASSHQAKGKPSS